MDGRCTSDLYRNLYFKTYRVCFVPLIAVLLHNRQPGIRSVLVRQAIKKLGDGTHNPHRTMGKYYDDSEATQNNQSKVLKREDETHFLWRA